MIELFTANTPNGKKISIMLEEIGYEYKVNSIDLNKGEQFNSEFKKISPFSKIPVIKDLESNEIIFESGAILIYLAEKSGKYLNSNNRNIVTQWLMAQMGYVGPILGQHHQFHHYNPGKSKFGEERYFRISRSIYKDLDNRLSNSKYLDNNCFFSLEVRFFIIQLNHEFNTFANLLIETDRLLKFLIPKQELREYTNFF